MKPLSYVRGLFQKTQPLEALEARLETAAQESDVCDKYFQLEQLRADILDTSNKQERKYKQREGALFGSKLSIWASLVTATIVGGGGPLSWLAGGTIVLVSVVNPDFMDGDYTGRLNRQTKKREAVQELLTKTDAEYTNILNHAPVADLLQSPRLHKMIDPDTAHGTAIQKRIATAFNTKAEAAAPVVAPAASAAPSAPAPKPGNTGGGHSSIH